jgi:dTDP-4-amino-4,6-dideoxygalactose transaminase
MIVFPILQILSYIKHQRPVDFEHDPPLDLNIFRSTGIGLRKEFPKSFFAHLCDWQYSLMRHQVITLTKKTNRRRELAKALVGHLTLNSLTLVPKGLLKFDDNSYYHFPIHCMGKKKEMRDFLFMNGIDNGSYGLNLCTEEHALCGQEMAMPMAKMVKHDSIFLPIHESYSFEHMKHIAQTVNQYVITDQS